MIAAAAGIKWSLEDWLVIRIGSANRDRVLGRTARKDIDPPRVAVDARLQYYFITRLEQIALGAAIAANNAEPVVGGGKVVNRALRAVG